MKQINNMECYSKQGHIHIISQISKKTEKIFKEIGFNVAIGSESDTSFFNFDAINVPKDHPARDSQDTFYLKQKIGGKNDLMRTHTSGTQIRIMRENKPPFKYLVPGKVFRNEATDVTHEIQFHQIELLQVGKNTSIEDLRGTLNYYFSRLFGKEVNLRFRPSFFPFTEPSIEIDIEREKNGKKEWLELLGAGMVHPEVLRHGQIDPNIYNGFAVGMGIERIAMMFYDIDDVRRFYDGDLRFINQF